MEWDFPQFMLFGQTRFQHVFVPKMVSLLSSAQIGSGVCRCGWQAQVPEGSNGFRRVPERFGRFPCRARCRLVPEGSGGFWNTAGSFCVAGAPGAPSKQQHLDNTSHTTSSNTLSSTHHHLHNIISTTSSTRHHQTQNRQHAPSTEHHQHNLIYMTSST